jgi:long-subunit acyl-CoA synthetase (AMP-forming)
MYVLVAGVDRLLCRSVSSADTMLAYLPLAHVLELTVESGM